MKIVIQKKNVISLPTDAVFMQSPNRPGPGDQGLLGAPKLTSDLCIYVI